MEEPHDLILDYRIQERPGRLDRGQTLIFEELRSHRSLIAGALGTQASYEARSAEIEARLELREQQ